MKTPETPEHLLAKERTLLAAERTFFAWLRTALSAMAGGLAILRLIDFRTASHKLIAHIIGETLILWGCALIIMSTIDYKRSYDRLAAAHNSKNTQIRFFIIVLPLLVISALLVLITLP